MKAIAMTTAFLASMSALAAAQESAIDELWQPPSYAKLLPTMSPDPEPFVLPRTLAAEADEFASFSIGPAAGYLNVKDADRGTWFGGVQARLHFLKILAAEAAITFHQNRYADGDVVVTQYPVQLTALLYIIPVGPVRPYILGGVGWYYTKFQYDGLFSTVNDRTEHQFGTHLGAGVELMLGKRASLDVDVRYIFINADNDQVIRREFNYWQVTAGLNFFF